MQINSLVDEIKPRAQQLHLIDPQTGLVDVDELRTYVHSALRFLASRYQLPMFLSLDLVLLRTVGQVNTYQIPNDVSLWIPTATTVSGILPRQPSGLVLTETDGTSPVSLRYEDPPQFLPRAQLTTTPGKPQIYTAAQGLLQLFPIPDKIYIVHAVTRTIQGEIADVPAEAVAAVGIEALYRMAGDRALVTPLLREERVELTSALVNDAARLKQAAAKQRAERDYGRYWRSSR